MKSNSLDFAKEKIATPRGDAFAYRVSKLAELGYEVDSLPYSIKVLLENALRFSSRVTGAMAAAEGLAQWPRRIDVEIPFMPYRVLLQDYTGVPLVVDLAAMRDAARRSGRDPGIVNSKVPVDLIIDHSIQVDSWSNVLALSTNLEKEYERNSERYSFLKWAASSFKELRVFPPGKGICHQVNLEYLSEVVTVRELEGEPTCFPDTLVGTDSHTTMVNGLGVLGWGVGGIEAEAVMLGEPYHMPIPRVLGVELRGRLQEGVTPTDLVLTVTEKLRERNVVGAFVEYFGDGYRELSVPDRATLGNMSPEYGATVGFSPVDDSTLSYLLGTGRDPRHVEFVRRYCIFQGLFFSAGAPDSRYSEVLRVDLGSIEPSVAGPRNPDERRSLRSLPGFARATIDQHSSVSATTGGSAAVGSNSGLAGSQVLVQRNSPSDKVAILENGAVVIAAITSCTNTSNPTVMVGAGLLAKKAFELGLRPKGHVKRSLAPGSTVVTDYLANSGLLKYLDQLGFNLVGYGCTTCIGNSGPLAPEIEKEIKQRDLYAVAVLSGNRNFDGRIHPLVKGSFLMSPILVVAYSLAGRIDFDFFNTPLGIAKNGKLVYLKDIWPSMEEIRATVEGSLNSDLYRRRYGDALQGDERWNSLSSSPSNVYNWQENSTYIQRPLWFDDDGSGSRKKDIIGARALAVLGEKVTTDHISPAGTIPVGSPAGKYLTSLGVSLLQLSTFGARRGNHEVMVRGGFDNIRLKNRLAKGKEGGWTVHLPGGELETIYDAAMEYRAEGVPLIILAGKMYGAGSSRDWAAKAPRLLGVKAVIAESFERIHRSNLIAMGVLPLQFAEGDSIEKLGLTGEEAFAIRGIEGMTSPKGWLEVTASLGGRESRFKVLARIDNEVEMRYVESDGVLPYVFNKVLERQK